MNDLKINKEIGLRQGLIDYIENNTPFIIKDCKKLGENSVLNYDIYLYNTNTDKEITFYYYDEDDFINELYNSYIDFDINENINNELGLTNEYFTKHIDYNELINEHKEHINRIKNISDEINYLNKNNPTNDIDSETKLNKQAKEILEQNNISIEKNDLSIEDDSLKLTLTDNNFSYRIPIFGYSLMEIMFDEKDINIIAYVNNNTDLVSSLDLYAKEYDINEEIKNHINFFAKNKIEKDFNFIEEVEKYQKLENEISELLDGVVEKSKELDKKEKTLKKSKTR